MPERCDTKSGGLGCVMPKGHRPGCVLVSCWTDDLPFHNAYPGPVLDDGTVTWWSFLRDVPHDGRYEVSVIDETGKLAWTKPGFITAFNRFQPSLVRSTPVETTTLVTAFTAFKDGRKIRAHDGGWQTVYGMVKQIAGGYNLQGRLGAIIKHVQHQNEFVEVLDD